METKVTQLYKNIGKLKNIFLFLGCLIVMFLCVDKVKAKDLDSIDYDKYRLIYNENGELISVSEDEKVLITMEYNDGKRIFKHGNVDAGFVYEDGYLISENRGGKSITYIYEQKSNGAMECTSFILDGQQFNLDRDSYGMIIGISDSNYNEIARYIYSGIEVEAVLKYDGGQWIIEDEPDFIGNYNKIRLYGEYFDDETGWYCTGSIYTDASEGVVVGLDTSSSVENVTEPCGSDGIMLLSTYYEDIDLAAQEWADSLFNNSGFVRAKTGDEINSMSTVEKISRAIYGENTINTTDQNAIAWVMLNRHHQWNNSFVELIVPSQFYGLASSEGLGTICNSLGWKNAVYLACLMLTDSSEDAWNHIVPKPYGISNQVYFVSGKANILDRENAFEDVDSLTKYTDSEGNVSYIYNIAMAGKGCYDNAEQLKTAYKQLTGSAIWCNIFFNKY